MNAMPPKAMQPHHESPTLAPLSAEDASLGRLRWIVALALTGLIIVGAAFQLGLAKLRSTDQPLPAASAQSR
ncbi:MAG TPA: hypothetical protein VMH36_11295 [Alphaproteobacteria bacterium]|nr:hypothetical protein [Alphaproteobacteria bacterium]